MGNFDCDFGRHGSSADPIRHPENSGLPEHQCGRGTRSGESFDMGNRLWSPAWGEGSLEPGVREAQRPQEFCERWRRRKDEEEDFWAVQMGILGEGENLVPAGDLFGHERENHRRQGQMSSEEFKK